jgi:hypothetical protein
MSHVNLGVPADGKTTDGKTILYRGASNEEIVQKPTVIWAFSCDISGKRQGGKMAGAASRNDLCK